MNIQSRTALVEIDMESASTIMKMACAYIKELKTCECENCKDKNWEERADEILNVYHFTYQISKIPRHNVLEVPKRDKLIEEIKKLKKSK